MKKLLSFMAMLAVMFLVLNCGGSAPAESTDDWSEVSDPLKPLLDQANEISAKGGVAAVGQGQSSRQDLAREKARTRADALIAEQFNTKVQRMKKDFQEEVGQGDEAEVNELFSVVTKTLTSQILVGAVEKDYKVLKKGNEYLYGVLKVITPESASMSILDEMQKKKPQLYQRYRASKAFEEMKEEMDKYEQDLGN